MNFFTPARWLVDSSTGSRYVAFTASDARRIARDWQELPGAVVTVTPLPGVPEPAHCPTWCRECASIGSER